MKKAALRIIAVILLVFSVSTCQYALKGSVADTEEGLQNLDIPLLEKTVKSFEEMAKKNPKNHQAPYYAAKTHFAIADCLDIKSDMEFDQTGEGEKHIDAALDLIKTSLGIKEDSLNTHILKFLVLHRKIKHVGWPELMLYADVRKAAYDRAKELAPDNLNVQFIGALKFADGWPRPTSEKLVAEFEKLLKKDPKMAEAYYQIGVIWEKHIARTGISKMDEAKKSYEKALELNPNHHWAQKKLKVCQVSTLFPTFSGLI